MVSGSKLRISVARRSLAVMIRGSVPGSWPAAPPLARAASCRFADRGADRPGAQLGRRWQQPAQAKLALAPRLLPISSVPFIEHHASRAPNSSAGALPDQQHRERYRGG